MFDALFRNYRTTIIGAIVAGVTAYQALGPGISLKEAILQVAVAVGMFLAKDGHPMASQ